MNLKIKKVLAVLLAALMLTALALPALAAAPFEDGAYASIITGSDFQALGTEAYERFGRFLNALKADGLETPDSMLVGGDYTKLLFDYAVPGETQIREQMVAAYPDADPERVVCIQGNHDNPSSGFTKTGFYDMGVYNLYVINEDDFPWLQLARPGVELLIKKLASNIEEKLNELIAKGDLRPVFVLTHLPLHHTSRALNGDNLYASYIFNALNKAGETLDIVFLFGHQHSGDYDDYIGGSVNFMAPGESIRVPKAGLPGKDAYTTETLTFTYANCGYVGYSDNGTDGGSTNELTLGVVRLTDARIRFVKYTESGLFRTDEVARKNASAGKENARIGGTEKLSERLWAFETSLFARFFALIKRLIALF